MEIKQSMEYSSLDPSYSAPAPVLDIDFDHAQNQQEALAASVYENITVIFNASLPFIEEHITEVMISLHPNEAESLRDSKTARRSKLRDILNNFSLEKLQNYTELQSIFLEKLSAAEHGEMSDDGKRYLKGKEVNVSLVSRDFAQELSYYLFYQ